MSGIAPTLDISNAAEPRAPRRLQLSRLRGVKLPAGAISVARPGRWGNPFRIVRERLTSDQMDQARRELRGHDLACHCGPGELCHADVLLEIANGPGQTDG